MSRRRAAVLWRKLYWRTRWTLAPRRPFAVASHGGVRLRLARSSASSGVFVNGGLSDDRVARLFMDFLRPGMTAIDCGAHVGEYTLLFSRLVGPEGSVHAFEPDPRLRPLLAENVAANGAANVALREAAVGAERTTASFELRPDPTSSRLGTGPDATTVVVESLDAYARERGLGRVDALKIDTEGAEAAVLRGAAHVLAELRPGLVFVECEGAAGPGEVLALLAAGGYEADVLGGRRHAHVVAQPTRGAS